MSSATVGSVLLYLNGVRVPTFSVTVTFRDGSPASGGAQIPWHPILEGLGEEDLVQVAVFYLDTVYYDGEPTYCLLFEGRLSGYTYTNNSSTEGMSLSFESNLLVLNDLSINFTSKASKSGSTANKDYPNQIDIKSKATSLLTSRFSGSEIKRPFDIIENIIYAVSGTYRDKNKYTDMVKSEDFYAEADRLTDALTLEYEAKLAELLRGKGDISDSQLALLEEEAMRYAFRGLEEQGDSVGIPSDRYFSSQNNLGSNVYTAAAALINRHVKSKASNYRDVVLSGFFARHMRLIRFREHWMCSPYLEGFPGDGSDDPSLGGGVFPMLRSKGAKKFFKAMLRSTGEKMGPRGRVLSLVSNLFSLMFYRIQEVPAPPAYIASKYSLPNRSFRGDVEKVSPDEDNNVDYDDLYAQVSSDGGHPVIGSYLTAPVAPYAIPPSCNVIFPCQRANLSLTNSTNSPPTRVYYNRRNQLGKLNLSSKSPGHNYDATRVGYPSIAAGLAQKAAGGSSKDLEALVFPEEYFRGPRIKMSYVHPSYSSIQDFANSARFSESKLRSGKSATVFDTDPEDVNYSLEAVEASSKKGISSYGLYYMLAQKEYQDARTSSRGGSVSTVFNPYVIPGFPCALLSGDTSGMQYYGKVNSVTHTLSNQGSVATSIELSNVRPMKEVLEQVVLDRAITDISPADPIKEIRSLLQVSESAEEYYKSLLKRGERSEPIRTSEEARLQSLLEEARREIVRLQELKVSYLIGVETFTALDGEEYTYSEAGTVASNLEAYLSLEDLTEEERQKAVALQVELKEYLDVYTQAVEEQEVATSVYNDILELLETEESKEHNSGSISPNSFDIKQFLGWKTDTTPSVSYINILDTDPTNYVREDSNLDVWGVPDNSVLVPLPETRRYFRDVSTALKYNSRPVCTMEDYIHFYAVVDRGSGIDELGRGRGIKGGLRRHSSGAVYYDVIRSFIAGPGLQPGSTVEGSNYYANNKDVPETTTTEIDNSDFRLSTKVSVPPAQGVLTFLDYNGETKEYLRFERGATITLDDLPDSRKDWQKMLLDYTAIIESSATAREG